MGTSEKKKYGYIHKIGENISICFLDGKVMKGKLLKVFQYEIILETEKNGEAVEVTVFKGAVKYII
ncbi:MULTISPECIES: hypothetical protein [Halobacillus]|uniref:hypothetical protein n=1 Tax=Halobacillus TaxID=45667 RepID=UPI0009A66ED4|nr:MULTISPECIES: hypothetical protein [Halobacillus]